MAAVTVSKRIWMGYVYGMWLVAVRKELFTKTDWGCLQQPYNAQSSVWQ